MFRQIDNDNDTNNTKTDDSKKNDIVPATAKVPNEAIVDPQAAESFNTLTQAFSAKQDILAKIATMDSYDIPATRQEPPKTEEELLKTRLKFDSTIKVYYNEVSNAQYHAIQKKKAIIDDMDRTIVKLATEKNQGRLPEDFHKLSQTVLERKDEYYNILFTLLLDLDEKKRSKCSQIPLYNVVDAWDMRTRFTLPNLPKDSRISLNTAVQ